MAANQVSIVAKSGRYNIDNRSMVVARDEGLGFVSRSTIHINIQ